MVAAEVVVLIGKTPAWGKEGGEDEGVRLSRRPMVAGSAGPPGSSCEVGSGCVCIGRTLLAVAEAVAVAVEEACWMPPPAAQAGGRDARREAAQAVEMRRFPPAVDSSCGAAPTNPPEPGMVGMALEVLEMAELVLVEADTWASWRPGRRKDLVGG